MKHDPLTQARPPKAVVYWTGKRRPDVEARQLRLMQELEMATREQIRLSKEKSEHELTHRR